MFDDDMDRQKILMLVTRPLNGMLSGRKMVLKTAYNCLSTIGDVSVFSISENDGQSSDGVDALYMLTRPRAFSLFINLFHVMFHGWSLNEAVFFSNDNLSVIRQFVAHNKIDIVYVDSIRMMSYFTKIDEFESCTSILDYDDIYSDRYEQLKFSNSKDLEILGFYGVKIPSIIKSLISCLSRLVLSFESSRIAKRELLFSSLVSKRVIVSPSEACKMSLRTGNKFEHIAMTVPDYKAVGLSGFEPVQSDIMNVCIFGNFSYLPNRQSLYYIRDEILPLFLSAGTTLNVDVIGYVDECFVREFNCSSFSFLGFVDDLSLAIKRSTCVLTPIVSGTGIKTKIVEAFSLGIPVVTNIKGVEGMDVSDMNQLLIADSPTDFYNKILLIHNSSELRSSISMSAYQYYKEHFSYDVIKHKWSSLLENEKE